MVPVDAVNLSPPYPWVTRGEGATLLIVSKGGRFLLARFPSDEHLASIICGPI